MSDSLSTLFNTAPLAVVELPTIVSPPSKLDDDADEVRSNLKNLMAAAHVALQNALNVAVQSESPRAYEVVSALINTAAELNTKILDTHTTQSKISTTKNTAETNNTTNNVIFNGTPSELAKLLKGN